jgi:hypothetical protein
VNGLIGAGLRQSFQVKAVQPAVINHLSVGVDGYVVPGEVDPATPDQTSVEP